MISDGKPVLVWRKLGGGKLKIRLAVFDLGTCVILYQMVEIINIKLPTK